MPATRSLPQLVRRLQIALTTELPGPSAQALLAPRPRDGWRPGVLPRGCRQAAALLLLYSYRSRPALLLTLRHHDLPEHAGQVSFPGGAVEPGESFAQAAMREAYEETGVAFERTTVLGALTPLHIPASGFHLHPLVATTEAPERFRASAAEVDRLIHCPLGALARRRAQRTELWQIHGQLAEVPYFAVDGLKVWGATAMVLAEFLALVGAPPVPAPVVRVVHARGDTLSDPETAVPVEIIQ